MTEQEMLQRERGLQEANAFGIYNHCEVVDVKEDYAEVRLHVRPDSLNFRGVVHGGVYFTMADICSGMASRTDERTYVTQSANVDYIRAVTGGCLTGRGRVIHRGRTGCLIEVHITDEEDRLVFSGMFRFYCLG